MRPEQEWVERASQIMQMQAFKQELKQASSAEDQVREQTEQQIQDGKSSWQYWVHVLGISDQMKLVNKPTERAPSFHKYW